MCYTGFVGIEEGIIPTVQVFRLGEKFVEFTGNDINDAGREWFFKSIQSFPEAEKLDMQDRI